MSEQDQPRHPEQPRPAPRPEPRPEPKREPFQSPPPERERKEINVPERGRGQPPARR